MPGWVYLAVYVPPGQSPYPKTILEEPCLRRYFEDWGRAGDLGFYAGRSPLPIGAAWVRLWPENDEGFGFVAREIPELTMAVRPEDRNRGIGTRLLDRLIAAAKPAYPGLSLSVADGNPARRLYERAGFRAAREAGDSLVMVLYF